MKKIDYILRDWRLKKISPFIQQDSSVLDIGCYDGRLFEIYSDKISFGLGIDQILPDIKSNEKYSFIKGNFPEDLPSDKKFDVITLIALIEHIPQNILDVFPEKLSAHLNPEGVVIITAPSPKVDVILDILANLKLISGMSLEEHYGFDPRDVPGLFCKEYFEMLNFSKFQFGLNNLFVFKKK